jgi:hypothetical protein
VPRCVPGEIGIDLALHNLPSLSEVTVRVEIAAATDHLQRELKGRYQAQLTRDVVGLFVGGSTE